MSEEKAPSPTRMGPGDTTARREAPVRREPARRGGFLGLLTDDWPLKVLALVLAVMMWRLTRDRLTRSEDFDQIAVAVNFEGPDGRPKDIVVKEIFPQFVKVTVYGTRAQIERAREAFRGNAKRVL